ncbi:MAG: hypothetical protein ACRD1L_00340 [Terriglobales bacterium]
MGTVRSIERRLYVRRNSDRNLAEQSGAAPSAGEVRAVGAMEWGGIWAGYMTFAGAAILLLALVFGVGFSTLNPLNSASWVGAGAGTLVWGVVVVLIATFLGAWVAARTPPTTRRHGMMRGVTLWGLILLSDLLLFGWVTGTALSATTGVAGVALNSASNSSAARVTSVLEANGVAGVNSTQAATISSLLLAGDRDGAVNALAADANLSTARAAAILGQVTAPAGAAASRAGTALRLGGRTLSWGLFWTALIGLGCALFGGAMGGGGAKLEQVRMNLPRTGPRNDTPGM